MDGGIRQLLGVVRAHRGAVEYDFRTRFGLGVRDIGRRLTICEAARLVEQLQLDTAAHVTAALAGWDYPLSKEAIILADLFDLEHRKSAERAPKPYPRPWSTETDTRHAKPSISQEEVQAALRRAGHTKPFPGH